MEIGQAILERIAAELEEVAIIEFKPKMEGRSLYMIVAPKVKGK
jgi:translation initiation factor IF-3